MIPLTSRKAFISFTLAVLVILSPLLIFAQDVKVVTVREGQTLRQIAEEYLNDPNLWSEILRANSLKSPADVVAGMKLNIPTGKVLKANNQLTKSLEDIELATSNGARLFAPSIITEAYAAHDRAKTAKNKGEWDVCYNHGQQASSLAVRANQICVENQNVPAQAVINFRGGTVQARTTQSRAWTLAPLHHILLEGDRVRTLSESFANILFKDESRLRLESNSLALIDKMRYNMLENSEESSISLLEGDIFAFLGGGRKGEDFDLDIEGVQTDINSSAFYASKEDDGALFANYDGELSVTAGGKTVTMGVNQGSVIRRGRAQLISKLLPQPKLISPAVFERAYGKDMELKWEKVKGAKSYWLEIAYDKQFGKVVYSSRKVKGSDYQKKDMPRALYYWRVSAIDKHGLPGPKSEVRVVAILDDVIPPYMIVHEPRNDIIVRDPDLNVMGEIESEAILTLDDQEISTDENGRFNINLQLKPGLNTFTLIARDPAGNSTDYVLNATLQRESDELSVAFDSSLAMVEPGVFRVQKGGFTLSGTTQKENRVTIKSLESDYEAAAIADTVGKFNLSVQLSKEQENFKLSELSLTGVQKDDQFRVEVDEQQPEIVLDKPIPAVIGSDKLVLKGNVIDGHQLFINNDKVDLKQKTFRHEVPLETGANKIRIEARDMVRNVAIIERIVVRDTSPPLVKKIDLSTSNARGGERIIVQVQASDLSGMKRAAPFTLKVGKRNLQGFLQLIRGENVYKGAVTLSPEDKGKVKLANIKLEDYHGNSETYKY